MRVLTGQGKTILKRKNTWMAWPVLVLVCIYLVNCFTPIRMTYDTIRYLHIKEWIENGKPVSDPAASDFLPHGYVWFLILLDKLHACKSAVIAFIQFAYLAASLWLTTKIFKTSGSLMLCLVLLL